MLRRAFPNPLLKEARCTGIWLGWINIRGSEDRTKNDHSGLPSRTVDTSDFHSWYVDGALLPLRIGITERALMRLRLIWDGLGGGGIYGL